MTIEKIYLDLDGVLADFNKHFENIFNEDPKFYKIKHGDLRFWEAVYSKVNFFSTIPPTPHYREILDLVTEVPCEIVILSAPSRVNESLCVLEKRKWVDTHISRHFPAIFERAKHKYSGPGRLLIDDYGKKCEAWREHKGIAHQYENIQEFRKFMGFVGGGK